MSVLSTPNRTRKFYKRLIVQVIVRHASGEEFLERAPVHVPLVFEPAIGSEIISADFHRPGLFCYPQEVRQNGHL